MYSEQATSTVLENCSNGREELEPSSIYRIRTRGVDKMSIIQCLRYSTVAYNENELKKRSRSGS